QEAPCRGHCHLVACPAGLCGGCRAAGVELAAHLAAERPTSQRWRSAGREDLASLISGAHKAAISPYSIAVAAEAVACAATTVARAAASMTTNRVIARMGNPLSLRLRRP